MGSRRQPGPAQIDPRASFLIAYRCSPNLTHANPPLDHPTDARRRGSSLLPFGSPPIRRSRRSPPSTSIPPEPHHPGASHRPHPHPSPISSTPDHCRRSRAPSPPPRAIVVPPPPVDPDLRITPSKVRSSPP
jgi:hypothetical protein